MLLYYDSNRTRNRWLSMTAIGIHYRQLTLFHNGLDKRLTGPEEAQVVHEMVG